jgi:hypothetical protein
LPELSGLNEKDCPATLDLELERRREIALWFTEETEPTFDNAVAIAISAEGD